MTHKIISINRLRIAVTFLQGTFHPKNSTAICFGVSLFDISVELSPFADKSMFWLSSEPIRLQEITYPDLVVARTIYSFGVLCSPSWLIFVLLARVTVAPGLLSLLVNRVENLTLPRYTLFFMEELS